MAAAKTARPGRVRAFVEVHVLPNRLFSTARRAARAMAVSLFLAGCGGVPGNVAPSTTGGGGGSGSSATCGSDTWSNYAQSFFSQNCAGCHGWASSQADVKSNGSNIQSRLESGSMPPNGSVSQSDVNRIVDWLNCGAP